MDFLYKQMRGKFSSAEQENEEEKSTADKKIPPQKSQSFKTVKRNPSWLQKQLSRQTSPDYSKEGDDEYQAAIAAAVAAIQSLEESKSRGRKKEIDGGLVPVSKPDDKPVGLERRRTRSVSFSDEAPRTIADITDNRVLGETETAGKVTEKASSFKKTMTLREHLSNKVNGESEKAIGPAPSMKKSSSFSDAKPGSSIPRPPPPLSAKPRTSIPRPPPPPPLPPPPPTRRTTPQITTKSGTYYTEADAWEKNELTKIKEKYSKISSTIVDWEIKKKRKAILKMEKIEAELDKKRAKEVQSYREKVTRVDSIAGSAKARAQENQRNEELKVKEKANKMRVTGKPPKACLCC